MNLMLINNRTHFLEVKLFLSNFSHIISVDCHFTHWRSILILSHIYIFIPIKRSISLCTISRIDFFILKVRITMITFVTNTIIFLMT